MTWFKVDDGLHSHPKWAAASAGARALWVTGGSWSAAHLTNGHVPRHVLAMLSARPRDAAELVRLDLWEENGDGWRFHDWELYQPTAEAVEAERAATRERQRRWRDKARESRRYGQRDEQSDERVGDAVSNGPPVPTRPTEDLTSSDESTTRLDPPDDDDRGSGSEPPQIVRQAVAILAGRDLDARQTADHLPPIADATRWENAAYDRRIAVAWPLVRLAEQHPDWTAQELADFAEPSAAPASPSGSRDVRATGFDEQQRAERARAEEHMRQLAEERRNPIETDGSGLAAARAALRKEPPT